MATHDTRTRDDWLAARLALLLAHAHPRQSLPLQRIAAPGQFFL
jgi:hypothetical protein